MTEGTNISVHASADGRLVTDLLGGIWVIPQNGGEANAIVSGLRPASRPRWSPNTESIAFQASSAERVEIWAYRFDDRQIERLSGERYFDQHPDWHPDGERLVFSSARHGQGFDLWELDLETRLSWRLSNLAGDETEPAWSADGRSLIYIHEHRGRWSLMLRRFGQRDEAVVTSTQPLSAPAWRPDGSLVTYLRHSDNGWSVSMTILSKPRLDRTLIEGEDFFLAPITWLDRQQMFYAANGQIRKRRFNSWTSVNVPFQARVGAATGTVEVAPAARALPAIPEPNGQTIIRAGRMFDGLGDAYRQASDIVIDGGRIAAITDRGTESDTHAGAIVIDLGDATVLPGFVDAYATLPESANLKLGPLLLSLGVTTMVAEHERSAEFSRVWSGKELPGPRVLPAASIANANDTQEELWLLTISGDMAAGVTLRSTVQEWRARGVAVLADSWQAGLGSGASLLLGTDTRPASPRGRRYQDVQMATDGGTTTFVSGLADAMTPNIADIWIARQASLISDRPKLIRRYSATPDMSAVSSSLVLGSRPNGLPPGIALHAEFRAAVAAGLNEAQALRAAGANAAAALGLGLKLGRIAPGAAADLVLVDGDPLNNIEDALKIIAVVRNGRFFSVSGLIDRAGNGGTVD